jgi:hypothetical protein
MSHATTVPTDRPSAFFAAHKRVGKDQAAEVRRNVGGALEEQPIPCVTCAKPVFLVKTLLRCAQGGCSYGI